LGQQEGVVGTLQDGGGDFDDFIFLIAQSALSNSKAKSTSPGVARQLVTFFCFAKKKVTQEKATPVCRPCGVPSISRKQAGLRNSTWRGAHPAPHCGTRTVLA
jgi:hypothetical protein